MFIKNNIKIKQYYRFIEFSLKLMNKELSHERCKLICLDEYKCETKEEIKVKRYANAFLYILNNANQVISKEQIKKIYYILCEEEINEEIVNKIMEEIYIEYDKNTYYNAAKLHLYVLQSRLKEKEKIAFLLTNLLMLKKEKRMVILYDHSFKEYEETIKNKDIYRLMLLFIRNKCSNQSNKVERMPTIDKIKTKIREIQEELKTKYLIEKIYLYGSYSKKQITKQSDLDLLIKYKEDLLSIEREEKNTSLRERLQEILKYQKIDFIDFTSAITKMDLSVLENIITII